MNKAVMQKENLSNNMLLLFNKQLDLWKNKNWNNKSQLLLFINTPKIYRDLGINNNYITISSSKLDRIINKFGKQKGNYHGLGLNKIKKIIKEINNPKMILKSSTVKNSIVIVTNLKDNKNRPIIISMAINGTARIEVIDSLNNIITKNVASNVITSIYGRNNYKKWLKYNTNNCLYKKS